MAKDGEDGYGLKKVARGSWKFHLTCSSRLVAGLLCKKEKSLVVIQQFMPVLVCSLYIHS